MRLFKKPAIPKKLGAVVDRLYITRQRRLLEQKYIDGMSAYETELKDYLIRTLPKDDATGVSGREATAKVTVKDVPQVEDWDALYAWIKANDAFDLLQRRLNTQAVYDRWENQVKIPGIGSFGLTAVSITKL